MRIAYHAFETGRAAGGALFFYSEVSRLLGALAPEQARLLPHDLFDLVHWDRQRLRDFTAGLGAGDLVVSNVGPYAQLYHLLRERWGGRFRIVRDVRTSSWAGFLVQEALCGPLTRPGDLVLFPSDFCRQYFLHLFPRSLTAGNTAVRYPLASSFPRTLPPRPPRRGLELGYIGRVADDKNFGQVLAAFAALVRGGERHARLHVAGPIDPLSGFGTVGRIRRRLRRQGVAGDHLVYHGHLPYRGIWGFLRGLDVFLFPAVASVESLGRVLLEAQYAGVPVVAAHYAAAAEILPAGNLVEPVFRSDETLPTIASIPLGRVDESALLAAIPGARPGTAQIHAPRFQPRTYLDLIFAREAPEAPRRLSPLTRAFIDAARVSGLRPDLDADAVVALGETLWPAFARYTDNRLSRRLGGLLAALPPQPGYPRRRTQHLARLFRPGARHDLGNAREHCLAAGLDPRLRLDGAILAAASGGAPAHRRAGHDAVSPHVLEPRRPLP